MKNTLEYAQAQDASDPLAHFRQRFHQPEVNGQTALYFAGNSLGLMPKTARKALETELADASLFAKNPDRFHSASAEHTRLTQKKAAKEDRWLELEELREQLGA